MALDLAIGSIAMAVREDQYRRSIRPVASTTPAPPKKGIAMVRTDRPQKPSLQTHVGERVVIQRTDAAPIEGRLTAHDGIYAYLTDATGTRHKVPTSSVSGFKVN
jgi:hypothetical protein